MHVIKRDGRLELLQEGKILSTLKRLVWGLSLGLDQLCAVAQSVIAGVYERVQTSNILILTAETAAYRTLEHPDFSILGARLAITALHKNTQEGFSAVVDELYHHINPTNGQPAPIVSQEFYDTAQRHASVLNRAVHHDRDFEFQYFGFKTLERSYLLRDHAGRIVERPQHMFMRVALAIHGNDIDRVIESYELMSTKHFTHSSSTLFNAGLPSGQLSPCFLQDTSDSLDAIFESIGECAKIAKHAGGIGLNLHNVRGEDSYIAGTGGASKGLLPLLRVLNNVARMIDHGGNKRPSSITVYLEPWHCDIFPFLEIRKNHGKEELRARDLFTALWVPDLFMRRVRENGTWSLFCPNEAPGLADVWGDEFEALYEKYESTPYLARRTVPAQDLWRRILTSQLETGTPFMLYKDSANRKSNQQHLGCIKSSNLCAEIIEYSSADETAVCNLASLGLPSFLTPSDAGVPSFDFAKLHRVTQIAVRNLDAIIDRSHHPTPKSQRSNARHRPLAIGVQGLADVFAQLHLPFSSPPAAHLNIAIFETIHHAALTASCALAASRGPHPSYPGSPASQGHLQPDLWSHHHVPSSKWDWPALRANIAAHGLRNSLLTAQMPTAGTSQILGFAESTEPYTSNLYIRRTRAGEFQCVNPHLVRALVAAGAWNSETRRALIASRGSVQTLPHIPAHLREVFLTAWEIPQRVLVSLAADRAPFIDQSQSLNLFMAEPTPDKLSSALMAGWKRGLKTGMYYLRTRAAREAIQFTVGAEWKGVEELSVGAESGGESSGESGEASGGSSSVTTVEEAPSGEVCAWGEGEGEGVECVSCSG